MIAADFDLNIGGFLDKLKVAEHAAANLKLPTFALKLGGAMDSAGAISDMQAAMASAHQAATPLQAILSRLEAGLHGLAAVARVANTAIAIMPGTFAGLHPAIGKTLSGVSLASRAFDVFRGKLSPLSGAMAYLELRNLGVAKSYAALSATMAVATSGVIGASKKITSIATSAGKGLLSAFAGLSIGASSLLGPMAAVGGAAGIAGVSFALLHKSITSAADFETIKTGFVTLLGSVDAASQRINELAKFAADTPFELPEVAKASRVLETLTKGALSTGAGLTLVGDVASGVNQPFEELAMWIGRLYDGLQSGRPVGEAMMRLQELGVISGDTRTKIEDLQKAGQKGDAVWAVASAALGRFAGNMKRQSETWNGLLSNLSDNIGAVFREFGTPVMDALKPLLSSLVDYTAGLAQQAAAFGGAVANAFKLVQQAMASGQIGDLLALSLQIGFAKAVNFIMASLQGLTAALMSAFETAPKRLVSEIRSITSPGFWVGFGEVLQSIGAGFVSFLSSALAPLLDRLISVLNKIPGVSIDFNANDLAQASQQATSDLFSAGAAKMKEALAPTADAYKESLTSALSDFQKAFASAPEYLQTGALADQLKALLGNLQTAVNAQAAAKKDQTIPTPAADTGLKLSSSKLISTSLAQLGLGGLVGGGATPDLSESKRQTRLLERTVKAVEKLANGGASTVRVVPIAG